MTQTPSTSSERPQGRKISPLAVTVIAVILLVLAFIGFASVWTEVLWFDQLGFIEVLLTQWVAIGAMFVIGFLAMALPVYFAISIAYRTRPVYVRLSAQLDRYQEVIDPLIKILTWLVPAVLGIFAGLTATSSWSTVLLWLKSEKTGVADPQFGFDLSFYLFDLAFWQSITSFTSAVLLITLIATALTSYLYGGIAFTGKEIRISKATRVQAGIIAALYLAVQGVSLWLDQYELLSNSSGYRTGALYTDVHAVIPGKQILAAIAMLVAVLFIVAAITGKWQAPIAGTGLLIVASLVVGMAYPWGVQEFKVKPDEKIIEAQYLARNIEATRNAFGIDGVETERYDAVTDATPGALRNDAVTTANIRIMDPEIISPTFAQLQQIRQYYKFPASLNVDRYEIDGKVEDAVTGVRDIDVSRQPGWVNQTLVYTHGYGLVAAYGNQRSVDGQPVFIEAGIPSEGKLGDFEPRVYFGLNSPPYSIVGGDRTENIELDFPADEDGGTAEIVFDPDDTPEHPVETPVITDDATSEDTATEDAATEGEEPLGDPQSNDEPLEEEPLDLPAGDDGPQNMTTFEGDGGPVLKSVFEKLIYALKFQHVEVLLSGSVAKNSQILYDRHPLTRVQKVAPYLTVDKTPYPSVVDERIVWIVDGYTTSSRYPYSEMINMNQAIVDADNVNMNPIPNNINYIRNSVKATVDAYDGSVTLYAWDTEDPILKAWSEIFPSSIRPISEMSGDLLSHVRYPSDMFKVQRQVLGEYHVTDSGAFYSREDAWRTPNNPVNSTQGAGTNALPQPPYYLTLAAGKEADPKFSIYSTYIPDAQGEGSRDILTGYLAANSNAGNTEGEKSDEYGRLKLLVLPKGNPVPGPGQVQNSFTTDSEVSRLLNLLDTGESQVISGNLLTLPVGGGLLYVQPVFVKASSGTSYPILQKLLVSFGDEIAFEDTLDMALDVLFGGDSGANGSENGAEGDAPGETETDEESPSNGTQSEALKAALKDMKAAIEDRDAAMQAGDWAAYGDADARLVEALERAMRG